MVGMCKYDEVVRSPRRKRYKIPSSLVSVGKRHITWIRSVIQCQAKLLKTKLFIILSLHNKGYNWLKKIERTRWKLQSVKWYEMLANLNQSNFKTAERRVLYLTNKFSSSIKRKPTRSRVIAQSQTPTLNNLRRTGCKCIHSVKGSVWYPLTLYVKG